MVTVGQSILLTGGAVRTSDSIFNNSFFTIDLIERYDGNSWTTLTNKLQTPRAYHCSVAVR